MVTIFQVKEVREFLLKHGFVYTFRRIRKRIGKDWITDRRGGHKLATVEISLMHDVDRPEELETYVAGSGFPDLDAWLKKIKEMHGQKFMRRFKGFIYFVQIKNQDKPLPAVSYCVKWKDPRWELSG